MKQGLYLYCVRAKTNSKFSAEGIDRGQVFTVFFRDLEAVVSNVSLKEFSSKEIQNKAQENLKWVKEKAQIHEQVIEEAMEFQFSPFPAEKNPFKNKRLKEAIPMKFGAIFNSEEKIKEMLKTYYLKFKENLRNLSGKQEWSVKAYLNRQTFSNEVKRVSPVVLEKEKEIALLPEGTAYFMQKQIDDAVLREADRALENYIDSFFRNLKECAVAGTKGKILEKELTGKSLPMILNAIFLISEEKLKDYAREINKLNKEYKSKGFNFEYSGPWPPYNFIKWQIH